MRVIASRIRHARVPSIAAFRPESTRSDASVDRSLARDHVASADARRTRTRRDAVTLFAVTPRTPTGGRDGRDDGDDRSPNEPARVARRSARSRRSNSGASAARPTISAGSRSKHRSATRFGLELDHELVLLHLQPSLEVLVAYADRIEAALLAQGWQRLDARPAHHEGALMTPTDPVRSTSDSARRRHAVASRPHARGRPPSCSCRPSSYAQAGGSPVGERRHRA